MEKLERAKEAGALGAIVMSDTNGLINPSVDGGEQDTADKSLADVALVVLARKEGLQLSKMLETLDEDSAHLLVEVIRQPSLQDEMEKEDDKPKLLYINGKALVNTGECPTKFRCSWY